MILSVAGYDPSSGAGITADIKTAAAYGCYAVTCLTALTVQSTQGVGGVQALAGQQVRATLAALANDFDIQAVRIGMLGSAEVAEAVAHFLETDRLPNIVLDPIIHASSGAELLDAAGVEVLRARLLPLATVVTPNREEAAALANVQASDLAGMKSAAERLHKLGARAVVVTGGHLNDAIDVLSVLEGEAVRQEEFRAEKVKSTSTHGTGCAFATALACNLAQGRALRDAVIEAKVFVKEAIERAYPLGKGVGPVNHLYRFNK